MEGAGLTHVPQSPACAWAEEITFILKQSSTVHLRRILGKDELS